MEVKLRANVIPEPCDDDLSSEFEVVFYNGGNYQNDSYYQIENCLKSSNYHYSKKNKNILLILKLKNDQFFNLNKIEIDSESVQPPKNGFIWSTNEKPSPLENEEFSKYEKYEKYIDFTKEKWNSLDKNIENKPDVYFEFKSNGIMKIKFKKCNSLKGRYLIFLFISPQYPSIDYIEIQRIHFNGSISDSETSKLNFQNVKLDKEHIDPIFSKLLFNQKYSDIQFKIQDSIIFAHKIALSSKSENLIFQQEIVEINKYSENSFRLFLEYVYTDRISNIELKEVIELYKISIDYKIDDLQKTCEEYISNSINLKNYIDFYFQHVQPEKIEKLNEIFIYFMNVHMDLILKDDQIEKLDKKFLVELGRNRVKYLKNLKTKNIKFHHILPGNSSESDSSSSSDSDSDTESDW
eukprot:gene3636-6452_t